MTKHLTLHIAALSIIIAVSLTACTRKPEGVTPVSGFDLSRYVGTWYEIMRLDHRFERGLSNVTATYGLKDDGTVSVINRGLNRVTCEWELAEGYAEFIDKPDIGSLAVSFFWPVKGGYHIFALDKVNYRWAAISGPSKEYLWILSRQPNLPEGIKADLVSKAIALGFPTNALIEVDHSESDCRS